MDPAAGNYDFPVDPTNLNTTYGLIYRRVPAGARVLDIGCASGNLARALEEGKGCRVRGVDLDSDAVAAALVKGVDAVVADVTQVRLEQLLDGELFDVVIMADVLEHLPNPAALLTEVRRSLGPGGVALASFPNITHIDIQMMLAQNEWRYVPAGILDVTHLRFFTLASFSEMALACGFTVAESDQVSLGALQTEVLDQGRRLRLTPAEVDQLAALNRGNPGCHVYQYVAELRPLPAASESAPTPAAIPSAPPGVDRFHLDVVVRTIAGRLEYLKEALYSLTAVAGARVHPLVVVHGASPAYLAQVEELISHYRDLLPDISVLPVAEGVGLRGRPLNVGLDHADGDFLAFLDDDDVFYPTFAQRLIGCLVADPTATVAYGVSQVVYGEPTESGFRATGQGPRYDSPFDRGRMFLENYIPINTLVVRRADLRGTGIRFDETLAVFEDWAFLCQLAARFKFAFVPQVVSEYRIRNDGSNAVAAIDERERSAVGSAIEQSLAGYPIRLSAAEMIATATRQKQAQEQMASELNSSRAELEVARTKLGRMLQSRSWKLTRPLRRALHSDLPE